MTISDLSPDGFSFYSLIPELKEESGHHVHYHTHIRDAVVSLGGTFTALMNRRSGIKGLSDEWTKYFRRRRKKKYILHDPCWLFLDFSKLFLKKSDQKRIFFLESFGFVDFVPLVLSSFFFSKPADSIWIMFRCQSSKKELAWQKRLLKWFRKDNWMVLSDSDLMGDLIRKHFRCPVYYLPHYIFTPPQPQLSPDKVECSWLGGPRLEKGRREIENLMKIQDPKAAGFRLSVSEQMTYRQGNLLEVREFRASLPREVYNAEFARAEVMLLPYKKEAYRYRTSGIFIEAILGGKVPLVKEGTWLAKQLKEYHLSELIVDWENPYFFTHLSRLVKREDIRERLMEMRRSYQELHSMASLTRYLEKLIYS
jgi:hypothetical protein